MTAQSTIGDNIFDIPQKQRRFPKQATTGVKGVRSKKTSGTQTSEQKTASRDEDLIRMSEALNNLLLKNPDLKVFTLDKILSEIGTSSFGSSLMVFSLPEALPIPIPGLGAVIVLPIGVLSVQMVAGQPQVRLPKFLLKRSVSRKALAKAIDWILPVLKRAENITKPRWKWATSPSARRLLGVFIFLLAVSIAIPIPGIPLPQAIAIFMIGLGLVERDGLVVCLGVIVGLASLLVLGGLIFSVSSFFLA